jgi:hypothetical protein
MGKRLSGAEFELLQGQWLLAMIEELVINARNTLDHIAGVSPVMVCSPVDAH